MNKEKDKVEVVPENNKVVTILSGGMDSATLLAKLVKEGKEIYVLTFDYGQRHKKEIECAKELTKYYKDEIKEHKIIDIPTFKGSALTDDIDVPEGHYAQENMKLTVVPNRNMIMLSIAMGYAESVGAEVIYYGALGGDHFIYWDCRPDFLDAMNIVAMLNDLHDLKIVAPFMFMDKGDIVCMGKSLGVPYQLTWTCYKGNKKVCGKCGSCTERLEAFKKAGMEDPISFEGSKYER